MHVLIQIDALQNSWLMGQILEINKNKKQCCLKCEIVSQQERSSVTSHILQQPLSKLVLCVNAENGMWFPDQKPKVRY